MKQGWEIKKLGDVGTFQRGGGFIKSDFADNGYPCIHYGQIHTKFDIKTDKHITCISNDLVTSKSKIAQKGDIIIAITSEDVQGSCKCTAWMGDYDVVVGAHAAIYKHTLNPSFVAYYLRSQYFSIEKAKYTHGFKVVEIKPSDIAKIDIRFPSLAEQERIVGILDREFERIDALKANAEQNLQHAKDLLIQSQNAAFDSEDIRPLDSVVSIINGYAFKSEDFNKTNPIKAVKITNVGVGVFVETDDTNLPQKLQSEKQDYVVHTGDIVFALTRTIIADGLKVAIVPETYNCALLNQRVASLRIDDAIQRDYLYNYFQSTKVRRYVLNRVNVLMQPNLSIKDLKAMPIPYCGKIEMEKIVARLNKLKEHCKTLEENYTKTIALCDDMKQAFLRKAFNGEL